MRYDSKIAKFAVIVALAVLCAGVSSSYSRRQQAKNRTVIKRYNTRIIEVPSDTVSMNDSARVRVSMYLDCSNKITRTETVVDTSGKTQKVILSVYGTVVEGPYRPMCASRRIVKDYFIHFPRPGEWFIETGERQHADNEEHPWTIMVR